MVTTVSGDGLLPNCLLRHQPPLLLGLINIIIKLLLYFQDCQDVHDLLHSGNINHHQLLSYAREAAEFSTNHQLPKLDFALNHHRKEDVAMFDFTSLYAAEHASRIYERDGYRLLSMIVGDSLLEVSFQ